MMVQATRCYDCGSYVSRDIYFGRFGKRNNVPLWVCPNCGVVHEDYRWFKYVSQQAKAQRKYETGDGPAEDVELRQYRCLRCNHVWYEDCDAPDYPDYCPGCGESLCRGGTQE